MKKLIPAIIILLALILGAGAGYFLRSAAAAKRQEPSGLADLGAAETSDESGDAGNEKTPPVKADAHDKKSKKGGHGDGKGNGAVYMKFSRQFVAPIVASGKPQAMMILDVNIEIDPDLGDTIYAEEPKLRDAVLKVLLKQGSTGALASIFADPAVLEETRAQILEETRAIVGDGAKSVLIMDIGYQML